MFQQKRLFTASSLDNEATLCGPRRGKMIYGRKGFLRISEIIINGNYGGWRGLSELNMLYHFHSFAHLLHSPVTLNRYNTTNEVTVLTKEL